MQKNVYSCDLVIHERTLMQNLLHLYLIFMSNEICLNQTEDLLKKAKKKKM